MKKFVFTIFIIIISFASNLAGELEGGIFNNGSTLEIKIKPTTSSFNSEISAAKFAIKYLTSYNVVFSDPVNPTGMSFALTETKTSGSYTYKFYSWTGAYTPNWTLGSENMVMEVTISGGTGFGDFILVSGEASITGSDPNWYVESFDGLTDGTSTEVYQSNATNVPLPVELTSFTASTNNNIVNLNWQTATEVNNYGFDIERTVVETHSDASLQWEKIGFVKGSGNSNSPKSYNFTDKNLTSTKFKYRLKQIDIDGKFEYSNEVEVEIIPAAYSLSQNYPNPFNPITSIKFELPQASKVTLNVYNILGEQVVNLINENLEAGFHSVPFNASELPSGTYIYRLQADKFVQTKKMILLK